MKMRHSAVPVDPKDKTAAIPQDDRLHIKVAVDDDTEKVFWVRKVSPALVNKSVLFSVQKSLGTGRVLDLLASQLKIPSSDASVCDIPFLCVDLENNANKAIGTFESGRRRPCQMPQRPKFRQRS
jgi:hypothetical protein